MTEEYLIGYYGTRQKYESVLLVPTAENIASFLVLHGYDQFVMITYPEDTVFISMSGPFIHYCSDQEFLGKELLPVLAPMQMNCDEPKPILIYEETENYEEDEL